ncbi:MAG: hypothetical protein NW241_05365 [Bacteroidia bacterium]|nr:hypothetical protein [Bacteroidia bacterium]
MVLFYFVQRVVYDLALQQVTVAVQIFGFNTDFTPENVERTSQFHVSDTVCGFVAPNLCQAEGSRINELTFSMVVEAIVVVVVPYLYIVLLEKRGLTSGSPPKS